MIQDPCHEEISERLVQRGSRQHRGARVEQDSGVVIGGGAARIFSGGLVDGKFARHGRRRREPSPAVGESVLGE